MNLLKNKMGMRVLTLALCAALGGSVLAVKAESVAGETVVQEAVQDENMSESREIDHPAQEEAEPDGQTETGEATEEPTAQPTDEPMAEPSNEPTTEPTDEPTAEPTEQPTTEPTAQPTTEPTAEPMPEGAYKITVVSPAKWQKDKATAKINIVDVNGTGWANIRIVVATENGWQTVVDGDDQSAGYAVELRENATIHVSITDRAGNVQAKSEAISCFDSTPPTVKAGVSGEVICIEATDSISGVAAVYVNGHKLKYSGTTLDANIRAYADGRQQIAIYAVDLAGNVSQKVLTGTSASVDLAFAFGGLCLLAFTFIFPLYWIVTGSFKLQTATVQLPPQWFPAEPTAANYVKLFKNPAGLWLWNSVFQAAMATLLTCFTASLAGYALAKKRFTGAKFIFALFVCAMALPKQVVMVPLVRIMAAIGLYNTSWAVIFPTVGWPFGVFLMKQFSETLPSELLEAARIDGAGELRTFWDIVLPIVKPGVGALAIFTFVNTWNDYFMQLIMLKSSDAITVSLGIARLQSEFATNYGLMMAGATLGAVPIVAVFICFQKYFTQGITMGAVKG